MIWEVAVIAELKAGGKFRKSRVWTFGKILYPVVDGLERHPDLAFGGAGASANAAKADDNDPRKNYSFSGIQNTQHPGSDFRSDIYHNRQKIRVLSRSR